MDGGNRKLGRPEGDKNAKRVRKYEDKFIEFGFIYVVEGDIEKPQCVICSVVLSAESMKPNKLQRHLETRHKEQVGNPKAYFIQLKGRLQGRRFRPVSIVLNNDNRPEPDRTAGQPAVGF